jgi:hypothetical protein
MFSERILTPIYKFNMFEGKLIRFGRQVLSGQPMQVIFVFVGLALFVGAFNLWMRAKTQPEDLPMYSWRGHRKLSKGDVRMGAIACLIIGLIEVIAGLAL